MNALPISSFDRPEPIRQYTYDGFKEEWNGGPRMIIPFAMFGSVGMREYRRKLWDKNPFCVYCKKKIHWEKSTLDHRIPKSKGGENTPSNLVLCCHDCNKCKDARSATQWADDIIKACQDIETRGMRDDDSEAKTTTLWRSLLAKLLALVGVRLRVLTVKAGGA